MFKFNLDLPIAEAHCDIPCKIYDPAISLIAATTIVRLIDLLDEVSDPSCVSDSLRISRIAASKEEHAMIIKKEVATIWGDYFKAPQFEQFPETDRLVHDIMLCASACKQGCNRSDALSLIEKLNDFAKIFWTTKGFETELLICPYPPNVPICHPVLESA
ncbi:MAG: superoxide dismutase, Ni [Gammaproteobacteria bacterium]|nr:superoxide dismutase, Ni [Gammaproteobacteria bacterium]|tara:strand:+ start:440 stop:919 length:480 start_codon:yes stop_codon:yes gene_type:complete